MSEEKGDKAKAPDRKVADKTIAMPMLGHETLTSIATEGVQNLASAASLRAASPRIVICNEAIKEIVPIDKIEFIFGRNPEAGAHHIIDHPAISGAHCKVFFKNDRFYLQDLGSKNHTFADGEMLGAETAKELRSESTVRIGAVEGLFVIDCDETGKKLDRKRYRSALQLLVAEGRVSALQGEQAFRDAAEAGCHPGELLLKNGVLRVDDWVRAYRRGEMFDLIQKEATSKTKKYAMLVLIQWIVIVVLLGIIVFKPDLFSGLFGGGEG
ncbi:MAG: FHA domain-containing protein [Planctomycetota bacterium]